MQHFSDFLHGYAIWPEALFDASDGTALIPFDRVRRKASDGFEVEAVGMATMRSGDAIATREPELLFSAPDTLFVPQFVRDDFAYARMQEFNSFIASTVHVAPSYEELLASGVVITGGSTLLAGMPELAEEVLGLPVRRGMPRGIGGLVDVVKSPMYATGVGLVVYGAKHQDRRMFRIREDNVYKKVKGRMREWLEEIF